MEEKSVESSLRTFTFMHVVASLFSVEAERKSTEENEKAVPFYIDKKINLQLSTWSLIAFTVS